MLSVARSTRTASDAELVNTRSLSQYPVHSQVSGTVDRTVGQVRLQLDLMGAAPDRTIQTQEGEPRPRPTRVQKTLQVNGVRRRSNDFVGVLKAVQFTPEDVDLTSGPPQLRRRFMDMLVSQLNHTYLSDWQEYGRILRQRNHLLRAIRDGKSNQSELEFWDIRFAASAGRIVSERLKTLDRLSEFARETHGELSVSDGPLSPDLSPVLRHRFCSMRARACQHGSRQHPRTRCKRDRCGTRSDRASPGRSHCLDRRPGCCGVCNRVARPGPSFWR